MGHPAHKQSARPTVDFGVYGATHPLQARQEIDDLDSYFDLDQALLRGRYQDATDSPWLIELTAEEPGPLDRRQLMEEVASVQPRTIEVRSRCFETFSEWTQFAERGIELRVCHILHEPAIYPYASLSARRISVDLSFLSLAQCPDLLQRSLLPGLQGVVVPVRVLLPLDPAALDLLDSSLRLLAAAAPAARIVTLKIPSSFPREPDDYQRLMFVLLAYTSRFRIYAPNYYRYARLHLYYKLPLLRLFIEADGTVLPFPLSPVPLGSLREDALRRIWEARRGDFWRQPSVRERFDSFYRLADMVGDPS